jgi:heme ABC exporter ATP-binding subunit CcmA
MAPAISFRDAVSLAGRFPLLAGVTLEVAEGEVVHLRGPNGAGKTSLLRACAGLVPIVAGSAEVLGYDLVLDRHSLRRQVGLLGHRSFLYEELSVEDNLRFAVRAARAPLSGIEPALELLGLAGRVRKSLAGSLSTGQRRRVALAVLVARSPALWLLDEPHAGLDATGRDVVDDLVAQARARGATVLLASHELERASALADRSVTIVGGRILEPGPVSKLAGQEPGYGGRIGSEVGFDVA